ncbi:HD domain-containing phosphohydrolase [Parahaliea mediterranea]|uniref:Transporter substrate-binding domain-containing protein n=1 Tax=Parahaliea mediterranea TaxID=651086 RepID=A0A939DJC5_9GAMM|nr:HD domain-containing phosphohydrolase [Parahaliea mediterranea]MBN7798522.1 transporter substrate-binding domain-containing protein [Parahaliea mediterranea]
MRVTIRVTVVFIFLMATLLTAAVAIGLQYHFGQALAKSAATDLYATAASGVTRQFNAGLERTVGVVRLLANNTLFTEPARQARQLEIFRDILNGNPLLYGIYIGRGDGSFLELINLDNSEIARAQLRATPDDKWVVVRAGESNGSRQRHFTYLDRDMNVRASRSENTTYDVRSREWYSQALANGGTYISPPYLFAQLGLPGQTTSRQVANSDVVIAVDRTLHALSEFLREQRLSPGSELFIYDGNGDLVASSAHERQQREPVPVPALDLNMAERNFVDRQPVLRVSNEMDWPPYDYALLGEPRGYSVDIIKLIAEMTGLRFRFVNGLEWSELVSEFRGGNIDILQPIGITEENRHWGEAVAPYAELPFALATQPGHPAITSLDQMAGKQVAIPNGWAVMDVVRRHYPDIEIVVTDSPADSLRRVLNGEVDATLDNEPILRYVQEHYYLGSVKFHRDVDFAGHDMPDDLQMLVQPGNNELADLLDRAVAAIGPEQREALRRHWLDWEQTRESIDGGTVPSDTLLAATRDPGLQGKLLSIHHREQAHFAYSSPILGLEGGNWYLGALVPEQSVLGPFREKVWLSVLLTSVLLLLILPLSWLFAAPIVEPVKALAKENDKVRRRDYDQVTRQPSRVKEIDELSESMVHMVRAIQAHEQAQRELMDAFIRLIAQAIDDKSPYTGGHCERVPELALMLAEQASDSDHPAFREFRLDGKEQWREFRIAAWLHDCGKITTPEHVVDKGSKLETIYNRIHEIRTRFEVLWRDAEIRYLRQCQADPEAEPRHRQALEQQRARLRDDFAFVAECNVGGEYLGPEKQQRLREIAGITWQRHFDDRVGLSPVEELRQDGGSAPLPATEHLLADKPEHIIPRTRSTDYPPEYGIDMDIPEHLYNQGEIYNLSISRGTLTAEDRFKINEHMISTIKMLESLPFPEELKNVPRYASTHHETMKGTGYPRKLPGAELSIPERLLAVADVFEALTAADRPYKKAKPVSVAVDILFRMVEDNHIDRDSFELFVREKVYLRYAERYLAAEQIDSVDEEKYLRRAS